MQRLDSMASHLLFALISVIAMGAPWLFGAWETWWFWPFVVCIFAAGACFAVRLMLSVPLGTHRLGLSTIVYRLILGWVPLLVYALVRALQAEVVMDAERSFLLYLTPTLLAAMAAIGLPDSRQRALIALIMANFAGLGLYGIANDYLAGNSHVLWMEGFSQYQEGYSRATGSYFCPDHFSGLMEIALAFALALLLVRASSPRLRLAGGGLSGIALWGIVLSRSRGGGIVAGVVIIAALFLCTLSWPPKARRRARIIGMAILALGATGILLFGGHYVQRFKEYPWTAFEQSDRYQMSAAALRGWQSAPWCGIGPGMHRTLWPHFAPSPDGDRATGRWPKYPNNQYHSYEAHDDWAQFLEEYGLTGLALLLTALGTTAWMFFLRWRRWAWVHSITRPICPAYEWVLPGILLAALAMTIHSIGDFNLQIPATTWLLGILTGLAAAIARHTPPGRRLSNTTHPLPLPGGEQDLCSCNKNPKAQRCSPPRRGRGWVLP